MITESRRHYLEALRSGGVRDSDKLRHFVLGTCRMTVVALRRTARRQERLLAEFGADLTILRTRSSP